MTDLHRRRFLAAPILVALAGSALAPAAAPPPRELPVAVPNDNRAPAGSLVEESALVTVAREAGPASFTA